MPQKSASDFDFEDWAGLYMENPQEFEARRQTALMIEMTRGSAQNAVAGRALLDAYEQAARGGSPAQRMQIASEMMMESAHQLSAELQILKQTLDPSVANSVQVHDSNVGSGSGSGPMSGSV